MARRPGLLPTAGEAGSPIAFVECLARLFETSVVGLPVEPAQSWLEYLYA